ncbi:MAG: protein kinase, partial [candidate division Zixibacteria bacterium]|nr:protein kinase [candidate division Zixibacteria bacterium]
MGRYTIETTLGQGGAGTVYRAVSSDYPGPVALKVLNPELADSDDYRRQLATEADLCRSVDSPFVVKVLDHDEADGLPYLAMEFVEGDDIRAASEALSLAQRIELAVMIAEGVQAAHHSGLVHRDLKPENILLASDGTPRILDFGLAWQADTDAVDSSGNVEGTLYYLAPEQLAGEPTTAQSDLFSYGVVLYEILTRVRPFEGVYSSSIIYSILHEDPAPPGEVISDLPAWVDELVMRLLAKRPQERPDTAAEVAGLLRRGLERVSEPDERYVKQRQTVTVIDLRNMSGDPSWDYFCEGFTEDVIKELSRRTNLVVTAEPTTSYRRNIEEVFDKLRSHFVVVGSLMKWQESIKLSLSIYTRENNALVWDSSFTDKSENLFDLLGRAAREASGKLSEVAHTPLQAITDEIVHDVTA